VTSDNLFEGGVDGDGQGQSGCGWIEVFPHPGFMSA
jgi:hypothetical protein